MKVIVNLLRFLALAVIASSLLACQSTSKKEEAQSPAQAQAAWTNNMQNLSQSLSTLLPLTIDPVQFNDLRNKSQIESELKRLAFFSHNVGETKNKPSDDPAMSLIAKQFTSDMKEAQRQMDLGNRNYSRHLIRSATNHCISCHTQSVKGPQFNFALNNSTFAKLNSLEKAHYLMAVRSFDEGIKQYEKAIQSPDASLLPYGSLEVSTLKALAVAVRVKKDPELALSIVNRIAESKWAPVYLQLSAMQWRDSIKNWQAHRKNSSNFREAKDLIARAWKLQLETPFAKAGLIENLRASAILHDLLGQHRIGKQYAEILYYAGLASEALKDLDPYSLSEHYFESCIQQAPRTETAKLCFMRLEALTLSTYYQFDSEPLPTSVREHLNEMQRLADPTEKGWRSMGERFRP